MTYNPFTYDLNDGFVELEVSKNVRKLSACASIPDQYAQHQYPGDLITQDIARRLTGAIIKSNLVNIVTERDHQVNAITYTGSIYVAEKPLSFVNVTEDAFIVQGQRFYEHEIIEAIKNTFPEKFI